MVEQAELNLVLLEQFFKSDESLFACFEKLVLTRDDKAPLPGLHVNNEFQQMSGIRIDDIVLNYEGELAMHIGQLEQSNEG